MEAINFQTFNLRTLGKSHFQNEAKSFKVEISDFKTSNLKLKIFIKIQSNLMCYMYFCLIDWEDLAKM